jgi:pimeloyl-ACP methyl ester carboxylesterase
MGANTAMLTAARHPDLVNRLVMIEGSPAGPETRDHQPAVAEHIRDALTQWPVPFADERAARSFFARKGLEPAIWTAGLEEREGQLWPKFEIPAGHGEQIVNQLPGAKLSTIRGAGHDVHLDAPGAWVRALVDE